MKQVTLRPATGLGSLKVIIVFADLAFFVLPFLMAAVGQSVVVVTMVAVVSAVTIAAFTILGRIGLDMRIEIEPDVVRSYYFWPVPGVIAREAITGVDMVRTRQANYVPCLKLVGNQYRMMLQLTARSREAAAIQVERLEQALRDVAPHDLSTL